MAMESETMILPAISLEHRELLTALRDNNRWRIADYSFTYLYIHRHIYQFRINPGPIPFAAGRTWDGLDYLMPLEEITRYNVETITDAASEIGAIFPVPEEKLRLFEGFELRIECDRGDSDYIYSIDKLKYYRGRRLHGQKNLLNQFHHNYRYEACAFTPECLEDAREVLHKWQEESTLPPDKTDYQYCLEGIQLSEELGLEGYIFGVNDRPVGFILGEIISGDTFTVLFAKGLRGIKGIYQFMNNYAALAMPEEIKYFNFEQDMGLPGLRKAKLSYNPDYILNKYRIILP